VGFPVEWCGTTQLASLTSAPKKSHVEGPLFPIPHYIIEHLQKRVLVDTRRSHERASLCELATHP
jgi:hypothetical protein